MLNHEIHKQTLYCEQCSVDFKKKTDLDAHITRDHQEENKENVFEWNCDDCPFQAGNAAELMKQLKVTAHQPCKNIKDPRKVYEDYKQF